MKRFILILLSVLLMSSCEDTNVITLTDAASDAVNAITLTDESVKQLALQASLEADSKHRIAPPSNQYDKRLRRLVAGYTQRDGHQFNFKVYLTKDINAFAMADGTIRVYSGLMDLMNDEELLFVIGHEMGHVVEKHSRKKVVLAYASSAIRKGLASQENEVGQIARSVVGAFAQQLTNAQFSQHEERQADTYGVEFLEAEGLAKEGAVSALWKLADLAKQHTFLSSHPHPEERAVRIEDGSYKNTEDDRSLLASLFDYAKKIVIGIVKIVFAIVKWILSFF